MSFPVRRQTRRGTTGFRSTRYSRRGVRHCLLKKSAFLLVVELLPRFRRGIRKSRSFTQERDTRFTVLHSCPIIKMRHHADSVTDSRPTESAPLPARPSDVRPLHLSVRARCCLSGTGDRICGGRCWVFPYLIQFGVNRVQVRVQEAPDLASKVLK